MIIKFSNSQKIKITRPWDVFNLINGYLLALQYCDQEKEHFFVIGLKRNNEVRFIDVVSMGTLTTTIVSGREVFRSAIVYPCSAIIIVHNHPSGNLNPSEADITLTFKLIQLGVLLDIHVMDHIIVAIDGGYYSFVEEDKMKKHTTS